MRDTENANRVPQIRVMRMVTGLGLKEAKDVCDKMFFEGNSPTEINMYAGIPQEVLQEFLQYFKDVGPRSKPVPVFNFRAEVSKLAVKAIKSDDLYAAKQLLALFV